MKITRSLAAIGLLLSIAACGFHLRGAQYNLQGRTVYVTTGFHQPAFTRHLSARIKRAGLRQIKQAEKAQYRLYLLSLQVERQLKQISTNTQVKEYRLKETLGYQLKSHGTQKRSPIQQITVQRLLYENANQLLSVAQARTTLQKEMHREIINRLLEHMAHTS